MPSAPYPIFDTLSLQDDHYITEEIVYRTTPVRDLESKKIGRRPGSKLIATDFGERKISIRGSIIADTPEELQELIDDLHRQVTQKDYVSFYLDANRQGYATVESVAIGDPHYSQSYVPMEISLLMVDPFFYGTQRTVDYTVASGTLTFSDTITISGSVFAEPTIAYRSPVDVGVTPTNSISVIYNPTAEHITWSGTNGVAALNYDSSVTFDYNNHQILLAGVPVDVDGVFSRWMPGVQSYQVTFSGAAVGGSLSLSYLPRYL